MATPSNPTALLRQNYALAQPVRSSIIPQYMRDRLLILSDSALKSGIRIVGGPGSGKSRVMGRLLARQILFRGQAQVIIDPTGGIVANLLDIIARYPVEARQHLWPRIVYADVAATDYIVPSPLYHRSGQDDTLFEIANRFPAVIKRQDPQLQSASIMGWNPLYECSIYAGQIAAALGVQIDFVADLIANPRKYKHLMRTLLASHSDLERAVAYFREIMDPNSSTLRDRRTSSFSNKLLPFLSDPTMLATFAAGTRGIDWEEVVQHGQTVILDFQNERDPERRQFKLIWWFRDFVDFIKWRGFGGRGQEIVFQIDEVTQLLGFRTGDGISVLAEDLEELVAVLARNFGVNLVIAHQNLTQVDERVRNVLMQCGTQMIGNLSNPDDALYMARQLFHYQPYWVKKEEPVWMSIQGMGTSVPTIIDRRDVEFTPEEQILMATEWFRLPRFQFLVRPALAEGDISQRLHRVSIEKLDVGQYPDQAQITDILSLLRRRCGVPAETLLDEIRARWKEDAGTPQLPMKSVDSPAILEESSSSTHDTAADIPSSTDAADLDTSAGVYTEPQETIDDGFWR